MAKPPGHRILEFAILEFDHLATIRSTGNFAPHMNALSAGWRGWLPLLAVTVWLAAVGAAIAVIARHASTPPLFDAVSYAVKAMNFWDSLHRGPLVNPFNLFPTFRPPGTILISYPFGFTPDFHWFHFRTAYIPIVLLAGAVYVAGYERTAPSLSQWTLAALALILAGMPGLYQFYPNDALDSRMHEVHATSLWGHMDNFLCGVCAIAMAAALRSVRHRSISWAVVAAATAAFCVTIKPVGFLVMAIVGLSWLVLTGFSLSGRIAQIRTDHALRRYIVTSLSAAVVIYAAVAFLAYHSGYLSPENVAYGYRAIAVFQAESHTPLTADLLSLLVHYEFGLIIPAALLIGLTAAIWTKPGHGAAIAAVTALAGGVWLLLVDTDPSTLRYFAPFAVMAFIAVTPTLMFTVQRLSPLGTGAVAFAAVVPTLLLTTVLVVQAGPRWQDVAGIRLPRDTYRIEAYQAEALYRMLQAEGVKYARIYQFDTTPPLYNFTATLDYRNYLLRTEPQVQMQAPVDWEHPSAFRFDQIRQADYVVFAPVRDPAARQSILAHHTVADFKEEIRLMNAWFSDLSEDDGVRIVSDVGVRLLRVSDPTRLESALMRLEESYDWPDSFRAANPQRWWSHADIDRLRRDKAVLARDDTFRSEPGDDATGAQRLVTLHAASIDRDDNGIAAKFWADARDPETMGGWYLFAHLIDAQGNILAGTQAALMTPPDPQRDIRTYTLSFPARPDGAVAIAFGFYRPDNDKTLFLKAEGGKQDWNGRRVLLPLPAP